MEDLAHLKQWLSDAETLAKKINTVAEQQKGIAVFTIATTVKAADRTQPYLTPLRMLRDGVIGGSLVFSQLQAQLLCRAIDGIVDWILVDAEKKIPITFGYDESVTTHFGIDPPVYKPHSRINVELGNL